MTNAVHEPADASRRPLLVGLIVTVVACIVGTMAVLWLLHGGRPHVRLMPERPRYYQSTQMEINEVESAPFTLKTDAERGAEAARVRLKSYGWVDRERQLVHVPIDVAIDLYLQRRGALAR